MALPPIIVKQPALQRDNEAPDFNTSEVYLTSDQCAVYSDVEALPGAQSRITYLDRGTLVTGLRHSMSSNCLRRQSRLSQAIKESRDGLIHATRDLSMDDVVPELISDDTASCSSDDNDDDVVSPANAFFTTNSKNGRWQQNRGRGRSRASPAMRSKPFLQNLCRRGHAWREPCLKLWTISETYDGGYNEGNESILNGQVVTETYRKRKTVHWNDRVQILEYLH